MLLISLLFALVIQQAPLLVEGVGEIKAGDTVRARKEALEQVKRSALSQQIKQLVPSAIQATYGSMLTENLLPRADHYIKNYSVEGEIGEGSSYRVKARVSLDQEKLQSELKSHGMLPTEVSTPKVALLLGEVGSDQKVQAWWMLESGAPASSRRYSQDFIAQRLQSLAIDPLPWRSMLGKLANLDKLRQLSESPQAANNLDGYLEIAGPLGADYLVVGNLAPDQRWCLLRIVRMEDHKFVGTLNITEAQFAEARLDTPQKRLDGIVFHLSGGVLRDWMERWQIERRVVLRFLGIDDLKTYQEVLKALKGINEIVSLQEDRFQRQTLVLKIGVHHGAQELLQQLKRTPYFQKRVAFTLKDEKNIEALLP